MSILIYKQRHRHPNQKKTPKCNYAHGSIIAAVGSGIAGSVIATAAGHQGQSHGERQEQCKKLFHCFASLK